ncbi:MAG TPA: DUF2442 domain-containing protein [Longimicrobium sp.]|jgi:hypothetical protein|nr:DUF2442 domain-containing protein [Longimicrobium sp.]
MATGRDDEVVDDLDAQIAAAHALTEYEDRIEPRAVRAWYDAERGVVMFELKNGCVFGFPPPEDPYWELADATPEQLAKVQVDFGGRVLLWDEIDAGIVVPGLLLHLLNVKAWYAKWLGGAKSEAKAAAARENGKKGGRPRKKAAAPKRAGRRKTAQAGD